MRKASWLAARSRGAHAGMVGQRPHPLAVEPRSNVLDLLAAEAIDDAALALVLFQELQQLVARLVAFDDGVGDVGPVEAGLEHRRLAEGETLDDVGTGGWIGRSGQRNTRHARKVGGN